MVPLRHGTSRVLLLITRYTPSLRLVPRRHFAFRVLLAHSLYTILEHVETSSSTKPAETSVSPIRAGVHTRALRLIRIVTAAGSESSLRVLSTRQVPNSSPEFYSSHVCPMALVGGVAVVGGGCRGDVD